MYQSSVNLVGIIVVISAYQPGWRPLDKLFRQHYLMVNTNQAWAESVYARLYRQLRLPKPQFLWFESSVALEVELAKMKPSTCGKPLAYPLTKLFEIALGTFSSDGFDPVLLSRLHGHIYRLWAMVDQWSFRNYQLHFAFQMAKQVFYRSIGLQYSQESPEHLHFWSEFMDSGANWSVPFEHKVLFCKSPIIRRWTGKTHPMLHADGEPALVFGDNQAVWYFQGKRLHNLRYHVHSSLWQADWLHDESNSQMRELLIEVLGHQRLLSELGSRELDSWREYKLLTLENHELPIRFLSMTCPSTGKENLVRVPPNETTAREAAAWIGWGVDPESYLIET